MHWGKWTAVLAVTGLCVGLAGCAQGPAFEMVEEMRAAVIEAGASGCDAEEAEVLNTTDSVGFRCVA